jgi:hypothetical protein
MNNDTIVHLNLYTEYAQNVLHNFAQAFLRGGGVSEYSWRDGIAKFERMTDGEVVLRICRTNDWVIRRSSWRTRTTVEQVKQFFIGQFFNAIRYNYINGITIPNGRYPTKDERAALYDEIWDVNCSDYTLGMCPNYTRNYPMLNGVTIGELKLMFKAMRGSKNITKNVSEDMFNRVVGIRRDPLQTEMEQARRDEIAKLKAEYEQAIYDLNRKESKEKDQAREEITNKYNNIRIELKAKHQKELDNLNNMVADFTMSA